MPQPTPRTLLDWLVAKFPTAKRQTLKRMTRAGRVRVNDEAVRRLDRPISATDRIVVLSTNAAAAAPPQGRRDARLKIVYEDAEILVVDKPAGLLTSTNARERRPTLLALVTNYLATTHPDARVGLIHRLDRDASGLLIFSKSDAAYHALKSQFFHHTVERVYLAVVNGNPKAPAGRIESKLTERPDGSVHSTNRPGHGQSAVTEYEVIERREGSALLRVTLQTGRKHQIRAHLSEKGMPIVNDPMYGDVGERNQSGRLMLMAVKLSVDHPKTGKRTTFELPPPKEFTEVFP